MYLSTFIPPTHLHAHLILLANTHHTDITSKFSCWTAEINVQRKKGTKNEKINRQTWKKTFLTCFLLLCFFFILLFYIYFHLVLFLCVSEYAVDCLFRCCFSLFCFVLFLFHFSFIYYYFCPSFFCVYILFCNIPKSDSSSSAAYCTSYYHWMYILLMFYLHGITVLE